MPNRTITEDMLVFWDEERLRQAERRCLGFKTHLLETFGPAWYEKPYTVQCLQRRPDGDGPEDIWVGILDKNGDVSFFFSSLFFCSS